MGDAEKLDGNLSAHAEQIKKWRRMTAKHLPKTSDDRDDIESLDKHIQHLEQRLAEVEVNKELINQFSKAIYEEAIFWDFDHSSSLNNQSKHRCFFCYEGADNVADIPHLQDCVYRKAAEIIEAKDKKVKSTPITTSEV